MRSKEDDNEEIMLIDCQDYCITYLSFSLEETNILIGNVDNSFGIEFSPIKENNVNKEKDSLNFKFVIDIGNCLFWCQKDWYLLVW